MNLPVINLFDPPIKIYEDCILALEDVIKLGSFSPFSQKLKYCINNAYDAAHFAANEYDNNALSNEIENKLQMSSIYAEWVSGMSHKITSELKKYQKSMKKCDMQIVSRDIEKIGKLLGEGQYLFHGGKWPSDKDKYITEIPLSTSLSPIVARQNALFKGKAYDNEIIDLFVLKVVNPKTKVFVYDSNPRKLGRSFVEYEVLFKEGAKLEVVSKEIINENFLVGKYGYKEKSIPFRMLGVNIS